MPAAVRILSRPWPLVVVALAVAGLVSACRALGFGEGVLLGATPASGLALGAAVVLRTPGAVAAAVGFAVAGSAWGLTSGAVATDAIAHGLAAGVAAFAMRTLARRRETRTRTSDWLIFLVGVCVFTGIVAAGLLVGGAAGALGAPPARSEAALRALVFEPFGILTFGAVLASLGELPRIRSDPRPALGVLALGAFLLALLWLILSLPLELVSPSGVTLLLSVPFCLWVAMRHRSLDGAALSFVASHAGLVLLLHDVGSIDRVEYVTAIIYLNLLVATCQLVHAVNLDRLAALAEVRARKDELEERVAQRTARLNAMTERALAADAAKTRFLATVSHEVRTPLNGVLGMASVILAGRLDPQTRQNVEIIRTSGHHMLDVINRILDFSRLDHAPRGDDVSDFDLRAVVEEVLQEARFLPYADGLDLRADLAPGLQPWRKGYRRGLRQNPHQPRRQRREVHRDGIDHRPDRGPSRGTDQGRGCRHRDRDRPLRPRAHLPAVRAGRGRGRPRRSRRHGPGARHLRGSRAADGRNHRRREFDRCRVAILVRVAPADRDGAAGWQASLDDPLLNAFRLDPGHNPNSFP